MLFYGKKVNKTALNFQFLFAARVLLFCIGVVCVEDCALQVMFVLFIFLVYLGAVLHCQKDLWTDPSVKYLHILNEVTILFAAECQLFS